MLLRKAKAEYEFQSTKVNHLSYMGYLKVYAKNINMAKIYSNDVGMEFVLDKCAIIKVKRGKLESTKAIKLPNDKKIQPMETIAIWVF